MDAWLTIILFLLLHADLESAFIFINFLMFDHVAPEKIEMREDNISWCILPPSICNFLHILLDNICNILKLTSIIQIDLTKQVWKYLTRDYM